MRRLASASCGAAVLGLATWLAAIPSARADMQVLESNVGAYPVGTRVADGTQFKLQAGERIKVMLIPSYRTRIFEGSPAKSSAPAGGTRGKLTTPD